MAMKIVAGLVAIALMLAYLLPPVFKLKETDLGVAIACGVVLMLVDLWHSLQKDD